MKSKAAEPKAPPSKPDPKDELKTLPMPEVEKRLGSSPNGLTQAEAAKRLTQYGPNEIEEEEDQSAAEISFLFLGSDSLDDRGGGDFVGRGAPLAGFLHHSAAALCQCRGRILGRAAGGQCHCRTEGEARDQGAGATRRKWMNPPARELVPGDVIRLRLGDIVPADARLLDGDSVEVDQSALTGESLPATRKSGEAVFSGSIIRRGEIGALVYATGGNTYFGKTARLVQEAHTVSHFQKAVLKIGNYLIILAVVLVAVIIAFAIYRGDPILTDVAVRSGADGGRDSRGDADGPVGDDGGGCAPARQEAGDCQPVGGDRRTGRSGHPVRRQDRHADPEQADPGRSVLRRQCLRRPGHPRWRPRLACGQ